MRIYSKIVIDMESGKLLHAEFHDYHGSLALAKKPKMQTTTSTVSPPELTEEQKADIVQRTRAGLASRGIASSGVGQAAEEESLRREEEGRRPTTTTTRSPAPPRGLFGLK